MQPPEPKTKVSLNNKTGLLEVYCTETGKLLAIQESVDEHIYGKMREAMVERLLPDGSTVLVSKSVDPAALSNFKEQKYSSYVVDLICQKMVEGMSLTKVCALPGFPSYATLCRWKKVYPGIGAQLEEARKDRAEALRDDLHEVMVQIDEDNIDSSKAKIDALKYLAGVDDKQKYGNAKSETVAVAPVQIIISTGINRNISPPEKVVEAKIEEISDGISKN